MLLMLAPVLGNLPNSTLHFNPQANINMGCSWSFAIYLHIGLCGRLEFWTWPGRGSEFNDWEGCKYWLTLKGGGCLIMTSIRCEHHKAKAKRDLVANHDLVQIIGSRAYAFTQFECSRLALGSWTSGDLVCLSTSLILQLEWAGAWRFDFF